MQENWAVKENQAWTALIEQIVFENTYYNNLRKYYKEYFLRNSKKCNSAEEKKKYAAYIYSLYNDNEYIIDMSLYHFLDVLENNVDNNNRYLSMGIEEYIEDLDF